MRWKRGIWFLLALVAMFVIALGWWVLPSSGDRALAKIRREGCIRIGYAVEAPFAFLDSQGTPTGLEIEVAKRMVAAMGIPRIEWCCTEFGALLPELQAGRFDAIVAGMFITPERSRIAAFSEPTFHVGQALLVQAGNPCGLHAYEDLLKNPQLKVAVLHGSVEDELLRRIGVSELQTIRVPDAVTGRSAVQAGVAGCLALSSPSIRRMTQQGANGCEGAQPFTQPVLRTASPGGYGAVVFRRSEEALRNAWNQQLRGFVGGVEHRRLLEQFGLSAEELPGPVSTAALLSGGVS